ncbi:hypothetical protein DEO72_LG8g2546 [Vigna unguiculata]|uniref:Uncharacterized protein n=1 Tax=Vigna unguiculata TaxID=3917 RepID=A0A4D6MSL9_VIGUN|nr:hypothetical protein DEO72_LG8g2546 [Vigna unguiculata]
MDPSVLATTSTFTLAALANPNSTQGFSCSSTILSSTRGMPFRAQLKECHVLNPYPELNSRDTFRAQLKEHQQPTFKASQNPVDHATNITTLTRLQ